MNLYETLGVTSDASAATIKQAYRRAAQKAHPDREGGDKDLAQKINEAYEILSVPERRKQYDETGDGKEKPSVQTEAEHYVMEAMAQVVNTPAGDIVTNATVILQGKFGEHQENMRKVDETEKKLLALKAKVKVKDGKPNLAHRVIDQRLEPLPRVRAEGARITKAYQLAFEILREHDAENTNPPEETVFSYRTGGIFNF